ncbi:MAG: DNA-directed RNA polymerase subunit beta [Thermovirgaceae bacterium]|nr:DNA-directed RNA polymerase subunit beta [Thermovirgaceae bacterium]
MAEFVPINSKRQRLTFGRARDLVEIPDMVDNQRDSFRWFFQFGEQGELADAEERSNHGLQELLDEIFPIESYDGSFALEFVGYFVEPPQITQEEACQRDLSWSRSVKATIRLVNRKTEEIKEEEVYLGDFPMMTDRGTFIINGTERVVVSQLARSAGVYFASEESVPGQEKYSAKVIPDRGAWLEFDMTPGEVLSVNIDNRKKLPVTVLLKAFGVENDEEVLRLFGAVEEQIDLVEDEVRGRLIAETVSDGPGKAIVKKNERITKEILEKLWELGRTKVWVWKTDSAIEATMERDGTRHRDEAVMEMFRKLRPNEPARMENAKEYINGLFFDSRRYNLGRVGRYKLNRRLGLEIPESKRLLMIDDVVQIVRKLMALRDGNERTDDIDHLGNRRVRAVGELLQNQVRVGLLRMERIARERMTTIPDLTGATARDLINVRPISASLREFFGSGQLSQFMDQTNPLAELTHRRRLSALGPGGLSRERAGFEARDVHYTHYGRICPIETPEGPNIGLVTSLSIYSRINEYGFLQSPKRKVVKGRVTDKVVYLGANEEDNFYIGRANTLLNEDMTFAEKHVYVRSMGDIAEVKPEEVDYLDLSPKQIVSASTALIPFLEHDDANRALMGSNMQRQAVPLIRGEAPVIGTGIEARVARDSGSCVASRSSGTVTRVDSREIEILPEGGRQVEKYTLVKFRRSNQGTIIHQKPLVFKGDKVRAGDIIADGQAVENAELALGSNVLVAFVSWEGYNYEDAILLSDRLVKEDRFSSIHIEEYEVEARDTKLGPEEITRDIPNVGEDALKDLDETGIVRVGAEVVAGDILVGKVTPKGESDQSPEEKLLRAIFGEKAREVRDTSMRIPHGEGGKVVSVKQLSRTENGDELSPGVNEVVKVYVAKIRKITVGDKMAGRHGNKGVVSRILPEEDMPYLPDGTPIDVVLNPIGVPSRMNLGQVLETILGFVATRKGWHISTAVFEGAKEHEILALVDEIRKEGVPELTDDGRIMLYDGRTGVPMRRPVTVGTMYMMKLIHLVDDKIHARSIGPYSLITQQPLGGKAQFGGQRFGEMEVWALEGYGASHVLQEMLTVKSDDIRGRLKTYERIVKGLNLTDPGVPESFRVLVKELQGLGLDVEIAYEDGSMGELLLEEDDEPSFTPARHKPREETRAASVKHVADVFQDAAPPPVLKDGLAASFVVPGNDSDERDPEKGADV